MVSVVLQKQPKKTWLYFTGKKTHDGSGTAWKESQTFVKELDDLAVEVSMEQRTQWMLVLSAKSSFLPALQIS